MILPSAFPFQRSIRSKASASLFPPSFSGKTKPLVKEARMPTRAWRSKFQWSRQFERKSRNFSSPLFYTKEGLILFRMKKISDLYYEAISLVQ
ncbi:hypothetical protein ABB08_07900 [Paenibacillus larvae]|nr:hypothetical protein [Paenibacillus larvae]